MRVITAVSAAAFLASQAFSHPHSATPRRSLLGRVVDLNAFRLGTVTEYSNSTSTAKSITSPSLFKRDQYVDAATALVKKVLPDAEFRLVDDHYVGVNGIAHVNFKQTIHGLDIDNADFNVNVRVPNPMRTMILIKTYRLRKMAASSPMEILSIPEQLLLKTRW
jgi:extracellular elastinolytic metalloproteinase